jgi:hypothetical protein
MPSSHLHLCLPSSLFLSDFPTKLFYAFVTCSSQWSYVSLPFRNRRDLVTIMMFFFFGLCTIMEFFSPVILCINCYLLGLNSPFAPLIFVGCPTWSCLLTYFNYSEKIKVGLWDHLAVCLCVSMCSPLRLLNSCSSRTTLRKKWFENSGTKSNPRGKKAERHRIRKKRRDQCDVVLFAKAIIDVTGTPTPVGEEMAVCL